MEEPDFGPITRWWRWVSNGPRWRRNGRPYEFSGDEVFMRGFIGLIFLAVGVAVLAFTMYFVLNYTLIAVILVLATLVVIPIALTVGRLVLR